MMVIYECMAVVGKILLTSDLQSRVLCVCLPCVTA